MFGFRPSSYKLNRFLHFRNYADVLASSEAHPPTSPSSNDSNLPQKVLESLFNISKTPEYEPKAMNWKNVVSKLQSLGPEMDGCTSNSAEAKQATFGIELESLYICTCFFYCRTASARP